MKIHNFLKIQTIALPALLALAACSGDVDNPLANGPVPLGVTAEIGQVMSRAAGTSFQAGDAIGVIPAQASETAGGATQYRFGYVSSQFTAQGTRYYFADTDEKTFHAYYPYTAAVSQNAAITLDTRDANQVVEKQDDQRTWRKNDYLAATATASASKPTATYTGDHAFRHVMAQVVLKFQTGGGLEDLSALSSYTLTTPLAMDGTFSPATGTVTVDESKAAETLTMGSLNPGNVQTFSSTLILLPQEVANGQLGLDVTYNNQTYRAALSLPEGNALTPGTSYAYTVTISQNGLNVGEAQIQNWTPAETGGAEALPAPFGDKPLTEADEGDYYFSDGSFADGSSELTDAQKDACIGIVFCKGQYVYDGSDYSQSGIGKAKCHGYVVALTDAHQGDEGLKWAVGEADNTEIPNFSSNQGNYSGYVWTQTIRKYAEEKYDKDAPTYFPAAYACLQYGEPEGPEWTHRFAAPSSSSGWFLPGVGQLRELAFYGSTVQESFAKLKEALPNDASIGWFSTEWYWSSMQHDDSRASYVDMSNSGTANEQKYQKYRVRAVLAF